MLRAFAALRCWLSALYLPLHGCRERHSVSVCLEQPCFSLGVFAMEEVSDRLVATRQRTRGLQGLFDTAVRSRWCAVNDSGGNGLYHSP
jgi:hypothetical protein